MGSIATDQSICYNSTPDSLTGIAPTGGNTPYTYQWQSSTDNVTFTDISGATLLGYQPGVLTDTTYYRQKQTSADGCGWFYTDTATINVQALPTVDAGSDDTIVLSESSTYTLSGSATNQQSVLWTSSGDGTFDDATSLTAAYTLGSNDSIAEYVTLTLTV